MKCWQTAAAFALNIFCILTNSRHANFGAVYCGKFNKLPRNKIANVVWEARGFQLCSLDVLIQASPAGGQVQTQTGTGQAKFLATKPKLFLTATVVIPPQSWVKLS